MSDDHPRFWHQLTHVICGALDTFDFVMKVIHLTATQQLPKNGFFEQRIFFLFDEGFDRQAPGRRCRDDRQVSNTGHRQIEGSRDGRCGESQDVNISAIFFQSFFLSDTKSMFFIDDQQSEFWQLKIAREELMGSYQNIDFALIGTLNDGLRFFG